MRQSVCPVCKRDILADFPGLRHICPSCERKLLIEEIREALQVIRGEAETIEWRVTSIAEVIKQVERIDKLLPKLEKIKE